MKKWLLSSTVFILSLFVAGSIGFYAALFLIGSHSGILPRFLFIPVGLLLLLLIIGIPVWLGKKTFIHFKLNEKI
jgi:hypothetical protein